MKTEPKLGRFENKSYIIAAFLFVVLTNATAAFGSTPAPFDAMYFDRARELIGRKKSLKGRTESSIVEYLQQNPESLKRDLDALVTELNAQPEVFDTTKHVRLRPPMGTAGYEDLRIHVSHDYQVGGKRIPASNLVQVLIDEISSAKKEIALNVYELDLVELATALIKAKGRGLSVRVGVDAKPLRLKPKQRAIVDRLRSSGIDVVKVNSVQINHQKMIAIDWRHPALARAVFSSGNFTYSCLDPLGDLRDITPRPEKSIPNANHMITMKSWLAANLINHEITKTFSTELKLRGRTFPTSGSYQITGPGVKPDTFEAYPQDSFIIAFTPGGGNRDVNRNILGHLLSKSRGPIRMTQFAYSSKDIAEALLHRAERDLQATGKFDFLSVGDTPFAMQSWSQFLKMSGLKRVSQGKGRNKKVTFIEDPENPWTKSLTKEQLISLRKNVRIAPEIYGSSPVKVGGRVYDVSSKIHHKLMSMGDFAVVGTSFNFSEAAESNNEQVLVFNDPKMAEAVRGITADLANRSPRSVFEEAERRMARTRITKVSSEDVEMGAQSAVP